MKGLVPRTTWPTNSAPRAVTCIREGERCALIGWEPNEFYALRPVQNDIIGFRIIRLRRDGK